MGGYISQGFYGIAACNVTRTTIMKRMWLIFAILSAVFAAATSILAKVGIEGVDSNLATAIRTVVVVILAWVVVFMTQCIGHPGQNLGVTISSISTKSWIFLILSGLATGASWLCAISMP